MRRGEEDSRKDQFTIAGDENDPFRFPEAEAFPCGHGSFHTW